MVTAVERFWKKPLSHTRRATARHGDHAAHNAVQDVLAAVLIRRAVISALDIGRIRALLVVFGCTHSWFRPLIVSQIGRSGRAEGPAGAALGGPPRKGRRPVNRLYYTGKLWGIQVGKGKGGQLLQFIHGSEE